MSRKALGGHMRTLEDDDEAIPEPSKLVKTDCPYCISPLPVL
ncbi:MAG: hypothetical protein VB115_08455 [Christensenellaceae bacterium]|nr:hypothetical protein [Christensenellaceae bacterium]